MVVGVFHLTHQIEIAGGSRHDAAIVPAARRRPALPPAGQPSLTASSRSHTSISPGGYDVTGLFQSCHILDNRPGLPHQPHIRNKLRTLEITLHAEEAPDPHARPNLHQKIQASN